MTEEEILDELLVREGGYRPEVRRPDGSVDPETVRGITLPTYIAWCKRHGAHATRDGFLRLSPAVAKAIYSSMFIAEPGFTRENIPYEPLRVQLIDFGVNSGPERAVRWLQRVLGKIDADGKFGPKTRERLEQVCGQWFGIDDVHWRLVNDALVAARSYMIDQAVDAGSMRKQDEEGVESRALSFFLARP